MANDTTLCLQWPTSGATFYTEIQAPDLTRWDGSAYAAFALAAWPSFATATPETPSGSGWYVCQFPTSSPAGLYTRAHYLQVSATPTRSGVVGLTLESAGSGYTNGTNYAIGFSGGTPAVSAAGLFDVVNGAVANLRITNCGMAFASAPALSFAAAGAGTGAAAAATLGSDVCVASGSDFWNGASFGSADGIAAITSGLASVTSIGIPVTVTDTAPTAKAFTVALTAGGNVPSTEDASWVGSQYCTPTGAKPVIVGYRQLSATTATITLDVPLGTVPANGDTATIV